MRKVVLLLVVSLLAGGCGAPTPEVKLNENTAIQTANLFLKAIMHKEYASAYTQFMSPSLKFNPNTDMTQFTADWNAIVEKYGVLQKAVFDAYQIVPGRRVIQLYYQVSQAKLQQPITYHLVLEQGRQGEFTIFIIDIGNSKPFPAGAKTPAEKLKKNEIIEVLPQ